MEDIIGGVSPFKRKRGSARTYKRGGQYAAAATRTGKQRGGFSQSKGVRGGGGRNVAGYNVQTRFKMDKWTPPASGGTMTPSVVENIISPPGPKPSKDKPNATADAWARSGSDPGAGYWKDIYGDKTTTEELDSYKKVWNENKNDLQGKYEGDFDKWVGAAKKWWEDEAKKADMSVEEFKKKYKKTKTERVKIGEEWVETKDPSSWSESGSTSSAG